MPAVIVAIRTVLLYITQKKPAFSTPALDLGIRVLMKHFSANLPFTVVSRGYRRIFFTPCDHSEDVTLCYDLFGQINPFQPDYPDAFLKVLIRRLTSASIEDRTKAKEAAFSLDSAFCDQCLHHSLMILVPPPPHGTDFVLEFITRLLPSCSYSSDLAKLESAFHLLHFAPHYQTFTDKLTAALKAFHEIDPESAHRSRLFILNNWPRLDPQRAVLFLEEATAICIHGPPIDNFVWERLAYRSSSIHSQLATAGLTFIQQTIGIVSGVDCSVLRFLLEDTVKNHWSQPIREKAAEVLKLVPTVSPVAPKLLSVERWKTVKEAAQANYPNADFSGRQRGRR
jgi:hypothetical protein